MKPIYCLLLLLILFVACIEQNNQAITSPVSPMKAMGDAQAIALAEKVIAQNGGLKNWDQVPFISFDYFGRRYWFWDKKHDRYRVESDIRKYRVAGKLDGSETHLWLRGNENTDPDSITKYKDFAYKAWINDTYWLIFPFKLLDPGVQLKYLGDCLADSTIQSTCIELTFDHVGITPNNKYIAYIDTVKNEIIYWDYFENKNDSLPYLSNTWHDYKMYGNVKISGGRGEDTIQEIKIHTKLPEEIFWDVARSYKEIIIH